MRAEEARGICVAAKGSSIRIPRHAPSYHIDLAIVTILSSPAMLACTIAARRGVGRADENGGRGLYRMVYHTIRRCTDMGRSGVNENDDRRKGKEERGCTLIGARGSTGAREGEGVATRGVRFGGGRPHRALAP